MNWISLWKGPNMTAASSRWFTTRSGTWNLLATLLKRRSGPDVRCTRREGLLPNFTLLRNALAQARWKGPPVDQETWRPVLMQCLASLNWPAVVPDVEPFLEDPRDRQLLDRKHLLAELQRQ